MSKKESFAKLTEDLEKLESIEKSVEEAEVVNPEPEAEKVEKSEDEKDKDKKDDKKKVEKSEDEEDEDKKDDKKKDDKKKVEKSEDDEDKDEDDKDKEDDKPVKKSAEEPVAEVVEEEVSKSVEEPVSEDIVTEQDFLGAFEAVVKSYSGLQEKHNLVVTELAEIKKSLGEVLEFISKAAHQLSFGEEVKVGEQPEAAPAPEEEVVEKSVAQPEEEELEGKAVEYVAKSVEGIPDVGVPAETVVLNAEPVEEPVVAFNPVEHVSAVTDYFMKNNATLSEGQKYAIRGAVNRVKRGDGNANDTQLFKEIVQFSE
jgi:hypothetical protein